MSRRIFIILIVILTLFLLALLGYYFLTRNNTVGEDGTRTGFSFFPFGDRGGQTDETGAGGDGIVNQNGNGEQSTEQLPQPETFTKRLRKISSEPVSGAGTSDNRIGTIIRYIEKATGHIYEVETFSPKVARISNTTIPLSYNAIWGSRPDALVARYLEDDNQTMSTYSLIIRSTSTTTINTTSGIIFPENISDLSVFGENIFYLVEDINSSSGFSSNFEGTKKKQIWDSEIKEFNSQFVNNRTVALTTRPHQGISGFLYFVDTENGSVKKILGDIKGLTALVNSDLSKILYTELGTGISTKILKNDDKTVNVLPSETFPEKCVWSKRNKDKLFCATPKTALLANSLTSWYKGLISFNDEIYSFDTKNIALEKVIDLENESGEKIDVMKPILSENEQYLIFINKIDNSLWSLDLTKTTSVSTTTGSGF